MCVFRLRPSEKRFPIIVSQDCGHAKTASAIQSYGDKVTHIQVNTIEGGNTNMLAVTVFMVLKNVQHLANSFVC